MSIESSRNIMFKSASAPESLLYDSHSCCSSSELSRIVSRPSSTPPDDCSFCDVLNVPRTKYSAEFPVVPSLRRDPPFPYPDSGLQKPWQIALDMQMQNANRNSMESSSTSEGDDEIEIEIEEERRSSQEEEDRGEVLISNAWKSPYPASWLEMGTDSEGEELDWNEEEEEEDGSSQNIDEQIERTSGSVELLRDCLQTDELDCRVASPINANKPLPELPRRLSNSILFRTKELGARPIIRRSRSQTVPQQAQQTFGVVPASSSSSSFLKQTSAHGRMEYLQLADRHSWYHDGVPLARIPERAESEEFAKSSPRPQAESPRRPEISRLRSRLDGGRSIATPQWYRSSLPSRVTFLPSLKRNSSSMRSLENFWDQKFGRSDSRVEVNEVDSEGTSTSSTNKGKGKRRMRDRLLFRSSKRLEPLQEEQTTNEESDPLHEDNNTPPPFSIDGIPTAAETAQATYIRVFSEDGTSVSFGKIVSGEGVEADGEESTTRTIVCFIRHFLCPLCQDYMYSIGRNVDPKALEEAGLRLVIIGNGAWQMIKGYRRIFKLPYPIYTDPTAALYTALGMTMRTLEAGPPPVTNPSSSTLSTISGSTSIDSNETYVKHKSILSGISLVLRNAVKGRMPIWRYMGDKALLGGEFIFVKPSGKDVACVWAHRMRYTTAHEEIVNVIGEAELSPSVLDSESCLGTECSQSFTTAMSSMSEVGSVGGRTPVDEVILAREMGFVEESSFDENTELSLRGYESSTSRPGNMSSVYSTNTSRTSSSTFSTWRKLREKELWSLSEKNRWNRMIQLLGSNLQSVTLTEDFLLKNSEAEELAYHLEVEIPEIAGDSKDEEDTFNRWFADF